MLTVDEIYQEIRRLEAIKSNRALSLAERIDLQRLLFARRHIELFNESHDIIDRGEEKSSDYHRRALMLIRDILVHTRDNWRHESDAQRKRSLNNIVRTALLLSHSFTNLYNTNYSVQKEHAEEINIWRNLRFLVQYQITDPDQTVKQALPIDFATVNRVLNEFIALIEPIFEREIHVGLRLQTVCDNYQQDFAALPSDIRARFIQHEKMVRQPYRDPHCLPQLEALANFGREKIRIAKMLKAIRRAKSVDVNTHKGRMSLLRQLQVIGESSTGKNLTTSTKRLAQNIDWQLLVRLRNKLSHNEWDICRKKLLAHAISAQLQQVQADMTALEVSVLALQQTHERLGRTDEKLLVHYDPAWYLSQKTHRMFLDFLHACFVQSVIDKPELKYLAKQLHGDIRERHLPTEIMPFIDSIFDQADANYQQRAPLRPMFQKLKKSYTNEKKRYQNLDHPDKKSQNSNERRLANHQQQIRVFENLISYSEETYKADYMQQRFSFSPIKIIIQIAEEMRLLKELLYPLAGSAALKLDYPENGLYIPNPVFANLVFDTVQRNFAADESCAMMERHIRTYCQIQQIPLYLRLDGDYGIATGEMKRFHPMVFLQQLPALLEPLKAFGLKCQFYTSLCRDLDAIDAAFFHLARIQKLIVVLTLSDQVDDSKLPNFAEFKALRNFVHHSIDLYETLCIGDEEFLARYAALFINKLEPALTAIKQELLTASQARVSENRFKLHSGLYQSQLSNDDEDKNRSLRRTMSQSANL